MGNTPNRCIRVPADLWAAAKAEAAERGESVSEAIVRALTEYTEPSREEAAK